MATDAFVLCRREVSDFGEPKRFCCKPIKTKHSLNWCDEDLARLPFWPIEAQEMKS